MAKVPTKRRSLRQTTGFWQAQDKATLTPGPKAGEATSWHFRAAAWPIQVTAVETSGCEATLEGKLIYVADSGLRFIAAREIPKGTPLLLRVGHPVDHDVLEAGAIVTSVTPPPPVGTTWVIGADFSELTRGETQLLSRWWLRSMNDPSTRDSRVR